MYTSAFKAHIQSELYVSGHVLLCFQRCSSDRQKLLDSLYDFVSRATQELIWLNEKEEEEVAFDWSERNSNISRKRDYHAVSPFSHIKVSD